MGAASDLLELSKFLVLASEADPTLRGIHHDMMPIISAIHWPPNPGTAPITGPGLTETYRHYFGNVIPTPPPHVTDEYAISNWLDCRMAAELWTRWRHGELRQ
jgi:hypothetical protein